MSRLSAAIDVAAEYAFHLYKEDGVPKEKAIRIGVDAVVRAARSNPSKFVTHRANRKVKDAGVGFDSSTIMGIGSVLSAVGFVRKLVTGA
jgi:hypothetical protein